VSVRAFTCPNKIMICVTSVAGKDRIEKVTGTQFAQIKKEKVKAGKYLLYSARIQVSNGAKSPRCGGRCQRDLHRG
jgi:hypothetical protein